MFDIFSIIAELLTAPFDLYVTVKHFGVGTNTYLRVNHRIEKEGGKMLGISRDLSEGFFSTSKTCRVVFKDAEGKLHNAKWAGGFLLGGDFVEDKIVDIPEENVEIRPDSNTESVRKEDGGSWWGPQAPRDYRTEN